MPPAINANAFISAPPREAVQTSVDTESPVRLQRESRQAWQDLIDHKLIEWGRDPGQFEDEGVEPPTGETIGLAIKLAEDLRDLGVVPPNSVVPDPNGGVVFRLRGDNVSEVFHVWDDGSVEYCMFEGTRLVERHSL